MLVEGEKAKQSKGVMLPNLRLWRERRGLSQRELGEKIGSGHDRISLYERGLSGAHPRTVRKLAEALDVTPMDLVG